MSNQLSPSPDPPPPDEPGITLQANAINVGGDVVGRDKTTNNITNIIHKFFVGGATEERDRRNRRIMLDKVRTFWVKGVLEQSLHGAALIELGMEYKPDAVQYPWNTVLQRPEHTPQPLPTGAKMIEVFDQEGGELLILGAPGSGKTTMLIDLARDLIARAEQDETLPIPVVFNLSSWAEKHPLLAEWLIEELSFRYDVPKKVGKAWIERDQVLPLLDGLDEVKLEQRVACVEAINNFRKEHLVHIAVCSRHAEYEALRAQLRLQSATVLQPLTRKQIYTYLESAGEQLVSIRTLLQRDTALQELAESPLILSIMVLAYRDLDVRSLPMLDSPEKQRKHLFDTYIQRMFVRRGADKSYTPQQVTHWLAWLARRMEDHNQTTFYLERMQPAWLPIHSRQAYSMAIMLFLGLCIWLLSSWFMRVLLGLFAWRAFNTSEIKTVERVSWSWQSAAFVAWLGGGLGVFVGGINLITGKGLAYALADGLVAALFIILPFGLVSGLSIGNELETKKIPNQGIWRSIRIAILSGLFAVLVFRLFGESEWLLYSIWTGLHLGGLACIEHVILRFILYLNGSIPLNYVRFLDYCAERIFLRKVGGGYIFIHRSLMEHFISLKHEPVWGDEIKRAVTNTLPKWVLGTVLSIGIIRKWLGSVYVSDAQRADRVGDAEQAFHIYAKAVDLVPNNPNYWNSYCWFGSLSGHAAEVMDAGERAVELAPDKGWIRDTRGLARALTGNYLGAIEDFKFYVKRLRENNRSEERRMKRESWITELEAGRNPFDEATLKELLNK